ncbi:serpin family protein [uncultured Jatrophihabitans sp.]|uniref:serpin family protein n=1 Tax=uncultured Jatrophihabitans sp. TaxID=1610747 RepID=UPI0035CB2D69
MTEEPDPHDAAAEDDARGPGVEARLRMLDRRPPTGSGWQPGDVVRATARRRRNRRALGAAALVVALAAGGTAIELRGGSPAPVPLAAPPRGVHVAARLDGAQQLVADSTPLVQPDAAAVGPVVAAEQRLTLALLHKLGSSGNTSVSPLSLYVTLGMLQNGARGETAAQIAAALQATGLSTALQNAGLSALSAELAGAAKQAAITFSSANSLWQQNGFPVRPQFLQMLAAYYSTGVWQTDFAGHNAQAVAALNRWTSEHTHGKITKLFDSLDPSTVLVLANALYFHAKWATPFDAGETTPMTFTTGSGRRVTAKFMTGDQTFPTAVTGAYQAVQLPYQGGRYAALAVMPTHESLTSFTAGLSASALQTIGASLKNGGAVVSLPRFTTTSTIPLNAPLKALGMRKAFDSGSADLSGLSAEPTYVDQVLQRVYLSVGEKGTTAAAATGIAVSASAGRAGPVVALDHPFLFLVRDTKTGAILFASEIQDPTAS